MSWVKKRGQPSSNPPTAPPQMYNPNQHSNQDNQWQQQQQQQNNWYQQQSQPKPVEEKQNYWQYANQQQPYSQPTQDYTQYYQNSGYAQQQQQPQQQPTYGNVEYSQQYNQNNVYSEQAQAEPDGWGSTWGWGDEDNSNVQAPPPNNIVESFSSDGTWNWSVNSEQEKKDELPKAIPSILTGKRGKLETPQWSVESQVSQESSDDVLQTSESDKSRMLSRSSTISHSPISGENKEGDQHFENKEILGQAKQMEAENLLQGNDPYQIKSKKANIVSQHQKWQQLTNLETLPDNSEQPDLQSEPEAPLKYRSAYRRPENNEAPINDRNQYLETGQLSDFAASDNNTDQNNAQDDTLPPPGLRRLVLGQMEQQDSNASSAFASFGGEPPVGLSRMVPGQTVEVSTGSNVQNEPPEGLRRLIPGESSSPEATQRVQQQQIEETLGVGDDSETELNEIGQGVVQQRSATIGADTPPAQNANRSETIGAAASSPNPNPKPKPKKSNRRDSIEGQIQDDDLINSVRNLTVGDSSTLDNDAKPPLNEQSNISRRHNSRPESSDSELERRKSPGGGDRRGGDRRYKDDRSSRRYSPSDYRDKKYDKRRYKERRYEDDTDYYSEKERERRHRDEYERKYSSLRKDKDKERKKRVEGGGGSSSRNYYGRYEESYEDGSRSRASSRSDSMHEAYRERGHERDRRDRRRDREKERHRRHHRDPRGDPFNPYTQGYGYDMYNQYYQQQYHYYENLRKTNPQAYAQWYRKYYQDAGVADMPSFTGEDRASVHSGRSSANDELAKDRYTRQSYYSQTSLPPIGSYYRGSQTHSISGQYGLDESSFARTYDQTDNSINFEDSTIASQRLTPAKFATAHIKATISSGKLIKVLPHYPMDGQPPSVEVCNLESFLSNDEDYQELKRFPGPLVKGTTHKKTILEYCERKIKMAAYNLDIVDQESYILMWELLMLLIRQNGMVVGADIAELLLKNRHEESNPRPASIVSSIHSTENSPEAIQSTTELNPPTQQLKEEEITNKFRDYLLYGSCKEALEWAMKHGLWGHALFLASKLDKRTYGNVLMRFANGLTMNDPLQTLYQLLSGKTPAAVTCVADEKWGDWRPHLAMILSNSTQRPELNCKAITILGDTLMSRGSLYAAQFCYLMAEVGFGSYGDLQSKLVLLGSNHLHSKSFLHFATNDAIHMTEIYEYACSLNNDAFSLPEFQLYKYLLATRLADVGLLERSLAYLEKIALFIVKHPGTVSANVVNQVVTLGDRLKYYDPVGDADDDNPGYDIDLNVSRPDNSWLKDLRNVQNDYNMGMYNVQQEQPIQTQLYEQETWQQQQQLQQTYLQQPQWNALEPVVPVDNTPVEYQEQVQQQQDDQQQQQYWQQQQQWNNEQANVYQDQLYQPQPNSYQGNFAQNEQPHEVKNKPLEEIPPPQISLPNQQQQDKKEEEEERPEPVKAAPAKSPPNNNSGQEKSGGNGWFGIFSKLSLKPKNQMKLPDDKNPSIVWDAEKKRWVNTSEDGGDAASEFKPPPKMPNFAVPKPQPMPPAAPTFAPINAPTVVPNNNHDNKGPEINGNIPKPNLQQPQQPNMFKLQRGRNLKKSYVDVFNPNGKSSGPTSLPDPATGLNPGPPSLPQMNFFIPQPVNDPNAPTNFLTPAQPLEYSDRNQQLSRWSSASSLSREVQSYTLRKPRR